ncbi:MAG TPA: cation:proton antiporter, partial [Steroidobacteraceae bacterium]|nr:cation:proton antiporter [Steroidobacteraceae bacterium]
MTVGLLVIALCTLAFALVAKRLSSTIVTAPMLFIALGVLLATTGLVQHEQAESALHLVAEIALIALLFLDAAQINLQVLRKRHVWPVRMLVLGLPLAILLGTLVAWALLPTWPLVALALVAAILAPTDAALGQAVVTNAVVPARARRALTVESGLNDGLALPIVLLFASLTAQVMEQDATNWLLFGASQLILGPVVGVVAGLVGGRALLAVKK